jgi:hypothetical protein
MGKAKSAAVGEKKPDQTWTQITQAAIKAQGLAVDYATPLGTRVSATFLTSFAADIAALSAVDVPGAITAHDGAVQLTAAQNAALQVGHNLVSGVRTAVRAMTKEPDVLLAYGVGKDIRLLVKDVQAALETIAARVAAQPAEAQLFTITTDDITAINNAVAAITAADKVQEAGRAGAPTTTKARNATARRLILGTKVIAAAGMRVFINPADATTRAKFVALK